MRVRNRLRCWHSAARPDVAAASMGRPSSPAFAQDTGMPITVETAIAPEIGVAELRVKGRRDPPDPRRGGRPRAVAQPQPAHPALLPRAGAPRHPGGDRDLRLQPPRCDLDLEGRESGGVEPRRRRRAEPEALPPHGRRIAALPDRRRRRRQHSERPVRDQLAVLAAQSVVRQRPRPLLHPAAAARFRPRRDRVRHRGRQGVAATSRSSSSSSRSSRRSRTSRTPTGIWSLRATR